MAGGQQSEAQHARRDSGAELALLGAQGSAVGKALERLTSHPEDRRRYRARASPEASGEPTPPRPSLWRETLFFVALVIYQSRAQAIHPRSVRVPPLSGPSSTTLAARYWLTTSQYSLPP
jgi:hypothetical protein